MDTKCLADLQRDQTHDLETYLHLPSICLTTAVLAHQLLQQTEDPSTGAAAGHISFPPCHLAFPRSDAEEVCDLVLLLRLDITLRIDSRVMEEEALPGFLGLRPGLSGVGCA